MNFNNITQKFFKFSYTANFNCENAVTKTVQVREEVRSEKL